VPDMDPQEAVQTALGIVQRAVRVTESTHLVCAFDSPDENLRRKAFPAYKAQRTTRTSVWVEAASAVFEQAGIVCVAAPGYEADDVIATIAHRVNGRNPIAVLSSDSDLLALASGSVTVWQFDKLAPGGFIARTPAWICTKYGIPSVAHLTLYKALVGEKGDNVPGVPLIGPVKARRLIAEFDTIAMMRGLGVLGAHADWAEQAMELLKLYTTAPVPVIAPQLADVTRIIERRSA
jgi:DNA polymerase-1